MISAKGKELCRPLHQIQDGHGLLMKQMQKISRIVHEIQQDSFPDEWDTKWYQLYQEVVTFLSHLKLHIYKEEHFLFPMLESYLKEDNRTLLVMDYEHRTLEQKIMQFIETFEKREKPFTKIEALSLLSCLEFAYQTIIDHFHKEEFVLFPFANESLSSSEKSQLLESIEKF